MSKNVSEVLLEVLAEVGVRHIYGIPGDAINGLIDEIRQQDVIRFVHVRHEEAGALAASAHAKLTGQLGVCVGTAGPGAIHLLNGLYDAKLDRAPVLAITGQVETDKLGSRYHQEVDLYTLYKDVAGFNQTAVNPAQFPQMVIHAIQTALAERTVAHLSLPADIATASVPHTERHAVFGVSAETAPCEADLDAAASVLNQAEKVTMLVGIGAHAAADEVVRVAEALGAPVVKTLRAKDVIADNHPLCVGGLGLLGTEPAVAAIEDADALLMVGTDFPYEDFYPSQAKAVQIDLRPAHLEGGSPSTSGWWAIPISPSAPSCRVCSERTIVPTSPTLNRAWVNGARRWRPPNTATTSRCVRNESPPPSDRSPTIGQCSSATPVLSPFGRHGTWLSGASSVSPCPPA